MALIENVFGMNGKFGDWVMCRRGGKTYVKRRTKIQAPATEMQEAARRRWKATVRFYQQLPTEAREFLNRVARVNGTWSGYNFFLKHNLKVVTEDGEITDPSLLLFSAGERARVADLRGERNETGIVLRWNNWLTGFGEENDRLVVIVALENRMFSPEEVKGVDAAREDGFARFSLDNMEGRKAHLYCCFVSPDGRGYSRTQHVAV